MAWSWWWQRWRRRPWGRRRRWRRLRARRPRRPVRRRRRRRRATRVRRRRGGRWGRKRGRRTFKRRRRRRPYFKPKKKLVLTQWNPQTVRRCAIRGMIPLVLCGHTTWNRNYAMRSEDYPEQGRYPFGGSMSTTTWSLRVLFDEHQKHRNRWSYPNTQLDLARYKGCRFTFYRHKKTYFIVTWSRRPPFKLNKYSSAMLHPGMMMQQKYKLLIPSWDTKPKGRPKITVRIRPPTLFEDKWYTQQDLCEVNLVSLAVSAASFSHPFSQPSSNNICTTFQVLKDKYYPIIGVLPSYTEVAGNKKDYNTNKTELEKWLYNTGSLYHTFHTQEYLNPNRTFKSPNDKFCSTLQPWLGSGTNGFQTKKSSLFGFNTYNPNQEKLTLARKKYWDTLIANNDLHSNYGKAQSEQFEYHLGWYSPIFLSRHRSNTEFATAYQDVTYNPNCDRGKGNRIWFQYGTKQDTWFNEKQCKCVLLDLPLWAMFYGYTDFIEAELGISAEIHNIGIVVVQCPYTFPPMFNKKEPDMGYVFYDMLFGSGKMPDGRGQVPIYWQQRWYPRFAFQQQVMHDITLTGPFSYKDDLVMTELAAKYRFDFLWGGNMISEQIVKNPCRDEGMEPSYPSRLRRDLQIVDPRSVGPPWVFHTWDYRRGLFGAEAIKRVSTKPTDDDWITVPYKKPRYFPPTEKGDQNQEEGWSLQAQRPLTSSEETEAQVPTEQQQQQHLLRLQLQEQQQLGVRLRFLCQELLKTQAGLHINPLFSCQQLTGFTCSPRSEKSNQS
nr:ORF1 [Torque teno virus 24]